MTSSVLIDFLEVSLSGSPDSPLVPSLYPYLANRVPVLLARLYAHACTLTLIHTHTHTHTHSHSHTHTHTHIHTRIHQNLDRFLSVWM